ncbi:hypothetical protein FACS189423_05280 [Bacteroidia bacterium]|nr:hypothetical protein FACS189423_05280 [Bacteroidia bacterium]
MKICGSADYLVLSTEENMGETIETVSLFYDYADVLNSWTNMSRVSPLYRLALVDGENLPDFSLQAKNYSLFFIGPYSPQKLDIAIFAKTHLWISYGFFNIVCLTKDEVSSQVSTFLEKNEVRFEKWEMDDKRIINKEIRPTMASVECIELSLINKYEETSLLYNPIREFLTLTKACFERIKLVKEELALNLNSIANFVFEYMKHDKIPDLSKFGFLTTLNACLSRFTSQSLSGSSPINKTESHLWGHSLLGIGIANLALHNLAQFINDRIGKEDIPSLLSSYLEDKSCERENIDLINIDNGCENLFWISDNLAKSSADLKRNSIVPIISYFSGRDGFRNQHNTLSAPLESLYACNTSGASLKTVTHEISHIIVRACIAKIIPSLEISEINKLFEVLKTKKHHSFKKTLQSFVLTGFVTASEIDLDKIYNSAKLGEIIIDLYRDVDEIMTHTFDYMYFYACNATAYLSELWSTWSEIPNIQNRIKEYSIRSICALMSSHIKYADCHVKAKDEFLLIMKNLINTEKTSSLKYNIMQKAVDFVENNWNETELYGSKKLSLNNLILRRKDLVRFVRTFLYSDKMNAIIHSESWIKNADFQQINRDIHQLKLVEQPLGNILTFIDKVSQSKNKSIPESLIIYYALAFNYEK